MSTSETDEFEIGTCPCGKGHIIKEVTTQDNPWSGADISYKVSCTTCRKLWRASRTVLTSIPDQAERDRAYELVAQLSDEIDALVADDVNAYFDDPKFKNMAQEQREMIRLGLSPSDIRNYRNGRNAGKQYAELCQPEKNPKWLIEVVSPSGKAEALQRLLKAYASADKAWRSKKVRQISFEEAPVRRR